MAAPLRAVLRCSRGIIHSNGLSVVHCHKTPLGYLSSNLSWKNSLGLQQYRCASFIASMNAEDLWNGVIGVSNAGKKKGRGKRVGRMKTTNLNKGQVMGVGEANIIWPGLNAPVIKGREVISLRQLEPDPERQQRLADMRDKMGRIRYTAAPPLLRGFTGSRFPGKSVGPPDPISDYTFAGFDSRVLQFRMVTNMTGTLGRKHRYTAFVVVGNKNGLAGFASAKSQNGRHAIMLARNKAGQKLMYIPRLGDHTVYHNMFTKYHKSKLFIHKKEKGYGLKCHRVLKACCELIGMKNLHCKVEGSTKNVQAVTKGFFTALANQETHQELADRMGYHVVEFRLERDNFPVIVASPNNGVVQQQEYVDEEKDLWMDLDRYYSDGMPEYRKPPKKHFYEKLESYKKQWARKHKRRNQYDLHILRLANLVN